MNAVPKRRKTILIIDDVKSGSFASLATLQLRERYNEPWQAVQVFDPEKIIETVSHDIAKGATFDVALVDLSILNYSNKGREVIDYLRSLNIPLGLMTSKTITEASIKHSNIKYGQPHIPLFDKDEGEGDFSSMVDRILKNEGGTKPAEGNEELRNPGWMKPGDSENKG